MLQRRLCEIAASPNMKAYPYLKPHRRLHNGPNQDPVLLIQANLRRY